jgi:hypothetical protein
MTAMLVGVHPVLAESAVTASVQFYARLGFTLVFQDQPTEPKYAVVRRLGVELHIQWADADQWAHPVDRSIYRFLASDVDTMSEHHPPHWNPN